MTLFVGASGLRADLISDPGSLFTNGALIDFNSHSSGWASAGPLQVGGVNGESVVWSATPIGYMALDNSAFGQNYYWTWSGRGRMVASAIDPGNLVTMSFSFATGPVSSAGVFMNYSTGPYNGNHDSVVVGMEALDANGNVLETYNLLTSAPIVATTVDGGAFRGITRPQNDIATLRLFSDGRFFAVDDLQFARIPSTLVAIAARVHSGTGDAVAIGGFVVSGGSEKRVLIRGVGPSLTTQGISAVDLLVDPIVEVYRGSTLVAKCDDWTEMPDAEAISTLAAQLGAFPFASSDQTSAALRLTLEPGAYTFIVRGAGNASGITLLEVYDAEPSQSAARFKGIAARAKSTAGDGVSIGGFVVSGPAKKRVLVRALGPTLRDHGLPSGDLLQDPVVELFRGSTMIATSDDWHINADANSIATITQQIGLSPIAPFDTTSSAMLLTLDPGVYSFIARGKNQTSGVVLVEVYDTE